MKRLLALSFAGWVALAPTAPQADEAPLRNGSPFLGEQDVSLPRQTVIITFAGGPALVPADRQGLTSIAARILGDGSTALKEDDYRRRLFLLNAWVGYSTGFRRLQVRLTAPPDRLAEAMELTRTVLSHPLLEPKRFEEARNAVLAETASRDDDMRRAIFYFGIRDAFGYNPRILDGEGSRSSVGRVTLEDLRSFLPQLVDTRRAIFTTVGPLPPKVVRDEIERAFLPANETQRYVGDSLPLLAPSQPKDLKITLLNKAGATDNQIFFVFPRAQRMDSPERAVAEVAQGILGGGADSRLWSALRAKRGLTYGVKTMLWPTAPAWMIWTFGGIEQTPELIRTVPEIVRGFTHEKISDAEVRRTAASQITDYKTELELPVDRLAQKAIFRLQGWDADYVDRHASSLAAVNASAVNSYVAGLDVAGGYLYVMGDRANLEPALKKLYPGTKVRVVEMSAIK